jgi:hypothetical protein
MSALTTILSDAFKAVVGGLPSIWVWVGGAAALGAALLGARLYWDHSVTVAADARIAQYVATLRKDETDLATIETRNNTKIQIQYQTQIKTITKVVHDNSTVITTKVPDINTILSDGWVSAFNSSAKGLAIDPTAASVKTPSGVNADQALNVVNTNNGICLDWKAEVDAWQNWYNTQKTAINNQNLKDGAVKK